jgi:hypothetical protein
MSVAYVPLLPDHLPADMFQDIRWFPEESIPENVRVEKFSCVTRGNLRELVPLHIVEAGITGSLGSTNRYIGGNSIAQLLL